MNKKARISIGMLSVAVVAALLAYSFINSTPGTSVTQQTDDKVNFIGRPPPLPLASFGMTTDIAQAKIMIPYHIPTIQNPPEGTTLRMVKVGAVSKTFALIYSPSQIPANATQQDLWFRYQGILVTGESIPSNVDEKEALKTFIAANPNPGVRKLIVINGVEAAGVERNPEVVLPSYINLYLNGARYNISADIHLADLIKIAESVDFRPQ